MKRVQRLSVRHGSSANKRCTVCVTVAADGTRLPLFVIFKGSPNGPIAKSLQDIIPKGMYGCMQVKGWMDNRVMQIWTEKIWKPYVEGSTNSVLLLDQMEAHVHPNFIDASDNYGTNVVQVPAGFKSVSQPCDAEIMKPLKTELVELCQSWKVAEYNRLGGTGKIPVPGRILYSGADEMISQSRCPNFDH